MPPSTRWCLRFARPCDACAPRPPASVAEPRAAVWWLRVRWGGRFMNFSRSLPRDLPAACPPARRQGALRRAARRAGGRAPPAPGVPQQRMPSSGKGSVPPAVRARRPRSQARPNPPFLGAVSLAVREYTRSAGSPLRAPPRGCICLACDAEAPPLLSRVRAPTDPVCCTLFNASARARLPLLLAGPPRDAWRRRVPGPAAAGASGRAPTTPCQAFRAPRCAARAAPLLGWPQRR